MIDSYLQMQTSYAQRRWKPSELEAGFFVEAARRIIELELFGVTQPIGKPLNQFNDAEIKRYESATSGDVSFRIHLPRALWSVYNLRNKRGVGHLSPVNPNFMDATYILGSCSWVLAELIRLSSGSSPAQCQQLVDSLVQRRISLVYEDDTVKRVLDPRMPARQQVLVLLYTHAEPVSDEVLRIWVEYQHKSNFRTRVLIPLHKERLIEYRDHLCRLTARGIAEAEQLLTKVTKATLANE
ncbi:hypothetical protein [Caldinitratiruptor microaerophilus]|uniref:hypothetical protein n=1 Tax=Caldinitratiruptor microaerophilus TaxID=671077 RepID=UPI00222F25A8|nr:hypothetical protein [Caldinitratiruptor microaerophilus]